MQVIYDTFPFERIFNLITDGVVILDGRKIVFCNDPFLEWTSYNSVEIKNLHLSQFMAPAECINMQKMLEQCELGHCPKDSTHCIFLDKEKKNRISVIARAELIKEGEWKNRIILTLKNNTKERQAQNLLSSSQQSLEEIIQTFPDIYYVTDARGILVKVGPSVKAILGYEPEEVVGTPMKDYYQDPSLRDKLMAQIIAGKGDYVRVEAYLVHKSGRSVWFNTRARFLFDANGNITGLEGLARDSTAEKVAQDLLHKREEELLEIKKNLEVKVLEQTKELLQKERLWLQKSRHEQMGEMISSIAHQWRQPLNVLSAWINNISSLYKMNELKQEDLDLITEKCNNLIRSMSQTIDEFRSFFSPMTDADVFDLGQSVGGALQLITANFQQLGIAIQFTNKDGVHVFGFSNEFGQVVINLLTNAKESFFERKIINPKIDISIRLDGDFAILEILDNAGGVPVNIIEKIFDPYFTTKEKGTGIGLYMSKNIVERHMKGQIQIENSATGAKFILRLPISPNKPGKVNWGFAVSPQAPLVVGDKGNFEKPLDRVKIIFVDDHDEARMAFGHILQKKGADIKTAASVRECFAILGEFHPDLIISDLLMPEEDGYVLIKKIRSSEKAEVRVIPAIALSAHVDIVEVQDALDAGFNKYLTKPIDWKSLMRFINELTVKNKESI